MEAIAPDTKVEQEVVKPVPTEVPTEVPSSSSNGTGSGTHTGVHMSQWSEAKLKSLSAKEAQALEELKAIYAGKKPKLATDVNTLLKFLEARDFCVKATETMLEDHMKWRKDIFPLKRSVFEQEEFVKSGAMYPFGFDKQGNPVMVIRSSLFQPKTRDLEACTKYMVFMIVYMFEKFPKHERFTVLYDRNHFSLRKNLDMDLIRNAAKVLSDNYPESLDTAYICPSGSVLRGIWKIAKHFFDPATRKKINFLPSTKHFIKYIDPEQLEKRYDGTASFSYVFKPEDFPEEIGNPDPWS